MARWIRRSSVVSTATVRNSTADLTKLEDGSIVDLVEEQLSEKREFSSNDISEFRSTTRCAKLDYCQSEVGNQGGVLASSPRFNLARDPERTRPPRRWGFINHDYVVLHVTGEDAKGRSHKFSIVAEKRGTGQAGDLPGIHIGLLSEPEPTNLGGNIFRSWNCFLTPVPLHVLTKNLWEDHDPNYNFINKNCWHYAQAACKNVLLLLSEQPGVTAAQKRSFVENAEGVRNSVVTKAALETTERVAIYTGGALVAGAIIFYVVKWLMDTKKTESTEHNNEGRDDSEDEK
ncbi:hypothetical protein Mapa_016289 [Marchantia paleacea]|nr:hypothetical protein Mapa_016289 [Marchantia paleacea]